MDTVIRDVRFAFRTLRRHPGFAAMALLILALGIGANTAVFSMVDGLLLHPLLMPEPERVVQLAEDAPRQSGVITSLSVPKFQAFRDHNDVFESVAAVKAYLHPNLHLSGPDRPLRITGMVVSSGFLPLLGVRPIVGRTFLPEEDKWDQQPAVILTHGFWQRHFGGNRSVVSKTLTSLSPEQAFTIVGVLPPDFQMPPLSLSGIGLGSAGRGFMQIPPYDMLISMGYLGRSTYGSWSERPLAVVARLKPDLSPERAQIEIDRISAGMAADIPPELPAYHTSITPLRDQILGAYGAGLYLLWAAAGFVLLLVCVNAANLMLARGIGRERELAVRAALGAGRVRILRLLLTEGALLGLAGGALGLLLAVWGISVLIPLLPSYIYRLEAVGLNVRILAFTAFLSILTVLLISLMPSIRSVRMKLNETLKGGATSIMQSRQRSLRALIVAQAAIALLLLVGANLMIESFRNLTSVDAGFDHENVLVLEIEKLPDRLSSYRGRRPADLMSRIIAKVESTPNVISAAGIDYPPLAGLHVFQYYTLADRQPLPDQRRDTLLRFRVTPEYLEAMRINLQAGRGLSENDLERMLQRNYPDPQTVERIRSMDRSEQSALLRRQTVPAVISQTMARKCWPGENPIGMEFYEGEVDASNTTAARVEVIGVVPDVKTKRLDEDAWPQYYILADQFLPWLVIRTRSNPAGMIDELKREIEGVDPSELRVKSSRTMRELFSDTAAESRAQMLLLAVFAAVSTVLAAVGLFGVMVYSVNSRTREIGVRMSLGAPPHEISRMILWQGIRLTGTGIVFGLLGSLLLTRFMTAILFGVNPLEPMVLVQTALVLSAAALLACLIPTLKAGRVDPVAALRSE